MYSNISFGAVHSAINKKINMYYVHLNGVFSVNLVIS